MEKRTKVKEITLNKSDLNWLDNYLATIIGLDSLDRVEILTKIEERKNVYIDI